jgi:hypothetical protein
LLLLLLPLLLLFLWWRLLVVLLQVLPLFAFRLLVNLFYFLLVLPSLVILLFLQHGGLLFLV